MENCQVFVTGEGNPTYIMQSCLKRFWGGSWKSTKLVFGVTVGKSLKAAAVCALNSSATSLSCPNAPSSENWFVSWAEEQKEGCCCFSSGRHWSSACSVGTGRACCLLWVLACPLEPRVCAFCQGCATLWAGTARAGGPYVTCVYVRNLQPKGERVRRTLLWKLLLRKGRGQGCPVLAQKDRLVSGVLLGSWLFQWGELQPLLTSGLWNVPRTVMEVSAPLNVRLSPVAEVSASISVVILLLVSLLQSTAVIFKSGDLMNFTQFLVSAMFKSLIDLNLFISEVKMEEKSTLMQFQCQLCWECYLLPVRYVNAWLSLGRHFLWLWGLSEIII